MMLFHFIAATLRLTLFAALVCFVGAGCNGTVARGPQGDIAFDAPLEAQAQAWVAPSEDALLPEPLPASSTISVGRIEGGHSVTAAGAATYKIPIVIPPGRRGIEPSLSINYNSHDNGNGLLGVGFSLSGFSEIRRCGRTITLDGTFAPVTMTDSDRLCLDGERLVLTGGSRYHADGAEYKTERDSFQKVVQYGSPAAHFLVYTKDGKVLRYGKTPNCRNDGPVSLHDCTGYIKSRTGARAWLLVEAGDRFGNAMYFDYYRITNNHFEDWDGDGTQDYTGPRETTEYLPRSIRYTANKHAAGGQALATREVRFIYERRHDGFSGFFAGNRVERQHVLSEIWIGVDGRTARTYELQYVASSSSSRSLLTSVTECGSDGVCKPATTFTWQQTNANSFHKYANDNVAAPPMEVDVLAADINPMKVDVLAADVNSDGFTDFIYPYGLDTVTTRLDDMWVILKGHPNGVRSGTVIFTGIAARWPWVGRVLDYNNDGKSDVLVYDSSGTWQVLVSTGDDFNLVDTGIEHTLSGRAEQIRQHFQVADLDGDGLQDLLVCQDILPDSRGPRYRWTYRLAKVNGFGRQQVAPAYNEVHGDCRNETFRLMDADGDGAIDLLRTQCCKDDGQGNAFRPPYQSYHFNRRQVSATGLPFWFSTFVKLDLNRDGLMDVLTWREANIRAWLNMGDGQGFIGGDDGITVYDGDENYGFALKNAVVLDYNGDGWDDLMVPGDRPDGCFRYAPNACKCCSPERTNWHVLRNLRGSALIPVDTGVPYFRCPDGTNDCSFLNYSRPNVIDDTGDLLSDVGFVEAGRFKVLRHSGPIVDLVTHVRDGMTGVLPESTQYHASFAVRFFYAGPSVRVSDGSVYSANIKGESSDCGDGNPMKLALEGCKAPRVPLVYRHYEERGIGNYSSYDARFDHKYFDARTDRFRRIFLGFGQKETTDFTTGAVTTLRFKNRTPHYKGLLQRATRDILLDDGHRQIEVTTYAWGSSTRGQVQRIYLTGDEKRTYRVLDGEEPAYSDHLTRTVNDYEYDEYNNITSSRKLLYTFTNLTASETTSTTYYNDPSSWIVGLPGRVTVTSTVGDETQQRKTFNDWDATQRVIMLTVVEPSSTAMRLETRYAYDEYGNVIETTVSDPSGNERSVNVAYGSTHIYPYETTNAMGHVTRTSYDQVHGGLLTRVGPNGLTTQWSYDGFGRVRRERWPDGTETTTDYTRHDDANSTFHMEKRVSTTGAGFSTEIYDRLGRPTEVQTPGYYPHGIFRVETTYNAMGLVATQSLPAYGCCYTPPGVTSYAYDRLGRVTQVTNPDGTTRTTRYVGMNVEQTDELGRVSSTDTNVLGQVTTFADAMNGRMAFTYGPFGNPRTILKPNGVISYFGTDAYGRVLTQDDANLGRRGYTYTAFGELETESSSAGTSSWLYDVLGRTTEYEGHDGSRRYWGWDSAANGIGKLGGTYAESASSSQDVKRYFGYDSYGRIYVDLYEIDGIDYNKKYSYDSYGRVARTTTKTPEQSFDYFYSYDSHGRLTRIGTSPTSGMIWRLKGLDAAGRVTVEELGNGLYTQYRYDAQTDRVKHIRTGTHTKYHPAHIQSLEYEYDAKGNLSRRINHRQQEYQWFYHNTLDRLQGVYLCTGITSYPCRATRTNQHFYFYDRIGNITYDHFQEEVRTYDPDRPQLLMRVGDVNYQYDATGNMIARGRNLEETVGYTSANKPSWIRKHNGEQTEFVYDADEDRVMMIDSDGTKTTYLFGMYERVEDPSRGITHRLMVNAGGRTVAVYTTTETPRWTYYHPDHLGSVAVTTDEDGRTLGLHAFTPFGESQGDSWGRGPQKIEAPESVAGFTGHRHDEGLGLINMRGRVYDPAIGRFLTPDPIVQSPYDSRSHNRYSYVWNNPLRLTDPSGYCAEEVPTEECNEILGPQNDSETVDVIVIVDDMSLINGVSVEPKGLALSQGLAPTTNEDHITIHAGKSRTRRASMVADLMLADGMHITDAIIFGDANNDGYIDGFEREVFDFFAARRLERLPSWIFEETATNVASAGLGTVGGLTGRIGLGTTVSKAAARGTPKLLPAFTQTTRDAVLASIRLAKGATTRGASLLEKRVAEGVITGIKPTQANAKRIVADVLGNPLRTQATGRFGQLDVVGRSFGQEVSIRINTQTGNLIGFRRVDF